MTNTVKFQSLINNQATRIEICKENFSIFFHVYFGDYVKYDTAPFQKEIMSLLEGDAQNVVITAFRGSGKSTIATLAYPLWCILNGRSKFMLLMSKTQNQSEQHLKNLKLVFETNDLIKKDFGPFNEYTDKWSRKGIEISKFDVNVLAASAESSIRGLRHKSHRPDLIIADDMEDVDSARYQKNRDKLYSFIKSEAIAAGDIGTRFIMLGNIVHKDAVIMRIKEEIESGKLDGVYREFPIMDSKGKALWKGKFPNKKALDAEKRRFGSETFWQREAMLNPISLGDRIIREDWIKYYGTLPKVGNERHAKDVIITIDPSVGESIGSDFTAILVAHAYGEGDDVKVYFDRHIINKRMTMDEMINKAIHLSKTVEPGYQIPICVETVAYQSVIRQELRRKGCLVKEVKPQRGKAERLSLVSHYFERGQVFFPQKGAEDLINQLLDFGSEAHDDLMDAAVYAIAYLMEKRKKSIGMLATSYFGEPDYAGNPCFAYGGPSPYATPAQKAEYYQWLKRLVDGQNHWGFGF